MPAGSWSRLCRRDIEQDGLSAPVQINRYRSIDTDQTILIEDGEIEGLVKDNGVRPPTSTNVNLLAISITIPTLANSSFGTITTCEWSTNAGTRTEMTYVPGAGPMPERRRQS